MKKSHSPVVFVCLLDCKTTWTSPFQPALTTTHSIRPFLCQRSHSKLLPPNSQAFQLMYTKSCLANRFSWHRFGPPKGGSMYSSVLKKWRAREAEEAKLLRPADTLTRSFGSKHCCSWQHRWTADLIAMLFFLWFYQNIITLKFMKILKKTWSHQFIIIKSMGISLT